MVRDSVQILEEVTECEQQGIPISYFHVGQMKEKNIISCQGDLITICNALADYAELLDDYLKSEHGLDPCGIIRYEAMRDKCHRISKKLQIEIGYDRGEAIEKCRKKAERHSKSDLGIGEEAMILSARKATMEKKKEENGKSEKQHK